jgi:hypothetical protein
VKKDFREAAEYWCHKHGIMLEDEVIEDLAMTMWQAYMKKKYGDG